MFSLFDSPINDFISTHSVAVIATVDEHGQPHSSTVFYVLANKNEVHFITKSNTTKSEDLKNNGNSAMTVTDMQNPQAVNLTGRAEEITDIGDRDKVLQKVFELAYKQLHDYAPIIKLHKGSFQAYRFIPKDAKFTDFTKPMGKVEEQTKKYK